MRIIAEFEKGQAAAYISHLDLMRAITRAIRRSGVPVKYSLGFNPHQTIAFASALSVGVTSKGELMDVQLEKDMVPLEFLKTLKGHMPPQLVLKSAFAVEDGYPSLMSLVRFADYQADTTLFGLHTAQELNDMLLSLLEMPVMAMKKGKGGSKEVDLRPLLADMRVETAAVDGAVTRARVYLRCVAAPSGALNPALIMPIVMDAWGGGEYKLERLELLGEKNGEALPLYELN